MRLSIFPIFNHHAYLVDGSERECVSMYFPFLLFITFAIWMVIFFFLNWLLRTLYIVKLFLTPTTFFPSVFHWLYDIQKPTDFMSSNISTVCLTVSSLFGWVRRYSFTWIKAYKYLCIFIWGLLWFYLLLKLPFPKWFLQNMKYQSHEMSCGQEILGTVCIISLEII